MQSILTGDPENLSHMVRKACRIAFEEGLVKARDGILITAGVPLGSPGATNMIRIAFVDEMRRADFGGCVKRTASGSRSGPARN